MTDHFDLIARLREPCIDWTGEPIVDGSTPRTEVHCGLLREASDALSSQSLSLSEAREEIERLKGLVTGIRECPQEPAKVDASAWKIVPVKPTKAMLDAVDAAYDAFEAKPVGAWCGAASVYAAMLDAAPALENHPVERADATTNPLSEGRERS